MANLSGNKRPVSIDVTDQDKNDALFFDAVLKGDMKQAKFFADRGADVRKPSGAHTPLRAATLAGHVHIVKWLVDELRVSPKEDNRALHLVSLSQVSKEEEEEEKKENIIVWLTYYALLKTSFLQNPSQELFLYLVDRGLNPWLFYLFCLNHG